MPHVLLVEPDDEVCLSLWYTTVASGASVTITESVGAAVAALHSCTDISFVIADAELPDGGGETVAAKVAARGLPYLLIHRLAGHLRVCDASGRRFEAPGYQALEFVGRALCRATDAASIRPARGGERRRASPAASNRQKQREDAMTTPRSRTENEKYRPGVGIMLLNRFGQVFVAQRIDLAEDAWQMPQGGIDDGEEPRQAALRELREEIGTGKAEFIDESKGWLRYDFPEGIRQQSRNGRWLGQRQKWFVMRFTGEDADIDLNTEHPEFASWKWVDVRNLPALVVSFKRQVYIDLLAEFGELTRSAEDRISEILREPIVQLAMAADSVDEKELFELLCRASAELRRRRSS